MICFINNFACWTKIFQLQKMYTFTLLSVVLRLLCMCGSSQGVLNILTLEHCSYTIHVILGYVGFLVSYTKAANLYD